MFKPFASALLMAAVVLGSHVQGQTDDKIEIRELKATLQISAAKIQDLETKAANDKGQINALKESLAAANLDCQQARENFDKLRLQNEGLGIAALDSSNSNLRQGLLSALSDLRILEQQKRLLTEALISLSETALSYAKSNSHGESAAGKLELDKALATAEKALGVIGRKSVDSKQDNNSNDLHNARIVSIKDEMGIAVLNVGSRQGVRPGMPFSIFREDKPVAHALIVDVRQGICAAVLSDLVSKDEPVKIGDTGRVETSKG
jgi:hypothetical protein